LTFINDGPAAGVFIQDAITEMGTAIAQQNGRFMTTVVDAAPQR